MRKLGLVVVMLLIGSGTATLAADFDGDGTGDIAVFRPSSGLWAVRGVTRIYFGGSADNPVPGDYDGSGTDSAAIFRSSSGLWAARGVTRVYFGGGSDEAKPGDYNGDGTYDVGIFRGGSGLWAIKGVTRVYFGSSGDVAIAAGKAGGSGGGGQCSLPVTGQTFSYQTGDDGYYQAGAAFNYHTEMIVGDMITVDHNTGLMWASDGNQNGCNWGQQTDWSAAIDWCNNLNFAGHTDWRLPNVKELQSILDYGTHYPAINTTYFINTKWFYYWSSTTYAYDTADALPVHFGNGDVGSYDKTNGYYVVAVRGGE